MPSFNLFTTNSNVLLPKTDKIKKTIDSLGANDSYLFGNNLKIYRKIMPTHADSIDFLVSNKFSEKAKNSIKRAIDKINFLFEIINPEYKFKYIEGDNLSYDDSYVIPIEKKKIDSIDEKVNGQCEMSKVFYLLENTGYIKSAKILINETTEDSIIYGVFLHELFHSLTFVDLDKDPSFRDTIMYSSGPYKDFSINDAYLLLALYGNYEGADLLNAKEKIDTLMDRFYYENYENKIESATEIDEFVSSIDRDRLSNFMKTNLGVELDEETKIECVHDDELILSKKFQRKRNFS